ncbi:uncharacterized protein LOC107410236 isoform X2 [Ziziphus jujuba]|uniref:Uncharacterized protein LOC107410236 isoform X2 n=1 Tax=Ziziphus jujuba TaxID=326968 RepID=A0ABM3ZUT3_ZIZJJ|nr:uncharacterized protein LOC107410236 isoform X2 [Ziziphus jujuba]
MGLGCEKRRLVVIGGGVAGSLIAKSLQFHADLTLIDQKEYFEIPWASLRTMVEPSVGERSVINHRDYLTNARIITSSAINISETEVLTGEGRLVPYDYLVIATGHTDPTIPKTRTERLKQYKEENEKIDLASSILIVGGGPTGVELAAEIAVDFPDKKLTLVHNGSRLLQFIGQKASDKTLNWLASKKVEVMLEKSVSLDNISNGNSTSYRTSDGETLNADCHFLCTAKSLGSTWLKHTVLESNLDSYGRLMVDENLRVKGNQTRIFGTETCFSGCKELEIVNGRRKRKQTGNIQTSFSKGNCITWEKGCSGTITIHNHYWKCSWID